MLESDLLGQAVEFEHKGKVYKIVNPITIGIEAAFARWCYTSALAEVESMNKLYTMSDGQEGLSDEQAERAYARINDQLVQGAFTWGSPIVSTKVNNSWPGVKYMMYLRFRQYQPGISLSLMDEIFNDPETKHKLKQLLNPTPAGEQK